MGQPMRRRSGSGERPSADPVGMNTCPVCGSEMTDDYVFDGEDEHHVVLCGTCGWPPNVPYSVEDWRAAWQARSEDWERWRAN